MLAQKSPEDFDADDFRRTIPRWVIIIIGLQRLLFLPLGLRFSKDNFPKILQLVNAVEAIGKKHGATPGQVALAWLLAQGDDIIPIPGTKKLKVRSYEVSRWKSNADSDMDTCSTSTRTLTPWMSSSPTLRLPSSASCPRACSWETAMETTRGTLSWWTPLPSELAMTLSSQARLVITKVGPFLLIYSRSADSSVVSAIACLCSMYYIVPLRDYGDLHSDRICEGDLSYLRHHNDWERRA